MTAFFDAYGPFVVPLQRAERTKVKSVDEAKLKEFWKSHADKDGIGCYALCHRAGRGQKPFYIGKTNKAFSNEAFSDRNVKIINQELVDRFKGSVVLYLARLDVVKKPNKKAVASLERTLVQIAHQKNPRLKNERLKEILFWTVRGAINAAQGKPSKSTQAFVTALGIPRP